MLGARAQLQAVPQRGEAQRERERAEQQRAPAEVVVGQIDAPAQARERPFELAIEAASATDSGFGRRAHGSAVDLLSRRSCGLDVRRSLCWSSLRGSARIEVERLEARAPLQREPPPRPGRQPIGARAEQSAGTAQHMVTGHRGERRRRRAAGALRRTQLAPRRAQLPAQPLPSRDGEAGSRQP